MTTTTKEHGFSDSYLSDFSIEDDFTLIDFVQSAETDLFTISNMNWNSQTSLEDTILLDIKGKCNVGFVMDQVNIQDSMLKDP